MLVLIVTFWSGIDTYATTVKMQQDQKVKGIVVDEKGEVIIGATIQVIDSQERTVTNIDGEFTIPVSSNGHLAVSYIGYETQKIAIGKQKQLRIVLKEENTVLNEVVVVGYGTMKRKEMTSAISHVSAKDLNQISSLDASMLLQGKVSSVSVSNTALANPNSTGSIQIRGISSRNASLSPLIVIDGIPGGDLTNINPADIESIDVLKDGAASAIYGTRGSNGVVLVNLKKGTKDGRIHTTYSTSVTFNKVKNELDIMNAEQYRAYCIPSNPLNDLGASTDWFDEAYKNLAFSTNHTVDVSGKTDRLNYYFSANYNFQDGMVKYGTDKYNRYNLRSKLDFKLTDWWTLGNNTSFVNSDYDSPNYLGDSYYWEVNRINPLDVTYNPDGSWTKAGSSVFGRLVDGGRWNQQKTTFSTQFTTKIDIIKDVLFVNGSFNYSTNKNAEEGYSLPVDYYDGPDRPAAQQDPVSQAYLNHTNARTLTFDAYATFHKLFNDKHDFTAMVGFNQEDWRDNYTSASRKELISSSLPKFATITIFPR